MTTFDPFTALMLPPEASVDRRVPKMLLIENGAFASGDRRRIREGIDELRWLAALKPATVGIAGYRDAEREYLEIAVLRLKLRTAANSDRLVELVHRAVPYPVVLIVWRDGLPAVSLAHKRRSLAEAEATVVDGEITTAWVDSDVSDESRGAFCDSLALMCQRRESLHAVYQGWMESVQAYRAAKITGAFSLPPSRAEAASRDAALRELGSLSALITKLHVAAGKERQIARRAEINLRLACLRKKLCAARGKL